MSWSWPLRERGRESYRYSHWSYDYVLAYEDRYSYRYRRSSVCDDSRRPSYTTSYGTYIYPPSDSANKYCPRTPDVDRTPPSPCGCGCGCGGRLKSPWIYRPARRVSVSNDASTKSRTVIDVVDCTDGPLSLRHGVKYPVSLAPHATVDDIISMLAPDRRRHKVVVKWRDGDYEDLDEMVPMHEIKRYAKRLDVKERKHVRWV